MAQAAAIGAAGENSKALLGAAFDLRKERAQRKGANSERSCGINIINQSTEELLLSHKSLSSGKWTEDALPPDSIPAGTSGFGMMESDGFMTGCCGQVTYRIGNTGNTVNIDANNPFAGSNHHTASASGGGFTATCSGGSGNTTEISVMVTGGTPKEPEPPAPTADEPAADEAGAEEQPYGEEGAEEQPYGEEGAEEQPYEEGAAEEQPYEEGAAEEQPYDEGAAEEQPAEEQPYEEEPAPEEAPAEEELTEEELALRAQQQE